MADVKSDSNGLMTIDALALASGMTVRTLRSHASRGLLPSPIMQGRVGYYNGSHLARLTFIREMQSAGFSLSSIEQILSGVPDDAGEAMLHIIRGLLAPWDAEPTTTYTPEQILSLFGASATLESLTEFADLVGAEFDPDGNVTVTAPGLLTAAAEAMKVGLTPQGVAAAGEVVVNSARKVAASFVQLFRDSVWSQFVEAGMPEEDWNRITGIHARLQPLAVQAFLSAFQGAMTQEVSSALSEELGSGAHDVVQRLLRADLGASN
jgi:DNA-binding transcriptional MerR regulator